MERLNRSLCGCGLGLILALTGCRSTKSEVPPGPRYSNDQAASGAGFGSEPSPGGPQTYGPGAQGAANPFGSTPGSNPYAGSATADMSHYAPPSTPDPTTSPTSSAPTGLPESGSPITTGAPPTMTAPSTFPEPAASAPTGAPSSIEKLPDMPQIPGGQPSSSPPSSSPL